MRSARRPKIDRLQLSAALSIIDDGVSKIVAEIDRQRPEPPVPRRRPTTKRAA